MPIQHPLWKNYLRHIMEYCYALGLSASTDKMLQYAYLCMQHAWPGPYTLEWDETAYIDKIVLRFESPADETMWLLQYSY